LKLTLRLGPGSHYGLVAKTNANQLFYFIISPRRQFFATIVYNASQTVYAFGYDNGFICACCFFVKLKQNSSLVSGRRKAFKFYLGCQSNEIILRAHFHKILHMVTAVLEISIL
jgi:hypothetical protein